MGRRAVLVLLSIMAMLAGNAGISLAAGTQQTFLTFYGWYDNTPPGGDIAYPQIHGTAGGKGTYADPITFATSSDELAPGTRVYVPRVKKYFIMEDSCQECEDDWSTQGPNGGPGLWHLDLWLGGQGGSAFDAIDCEDALTHYNADGTPTLEPVIINPGSSEVYDSTPIFNTSTGACYGGAQPNTTIGSYKNVSSGQCLEAPGGTALKVAACTGGTGQRFSFHGAFLVINDNQCATISGSSVVLSTCTGGPAQQWSINPNGTISDIQSGQKCIRQSSSNVVAGSCSGTASQWTFTSAGLALAVNPAAGTANPGSAVTTTVTTSGPAGQVTLSASGLPAGATAAFNPATVTVGGTSTLTITTGASTPAGTYPVTVSGSGSSATYQLTVGATGDYQAEDATLSAAGVFTNHTGYTGSGFVDYVNAAGGYIEWSVAVSGTRTLTLRYANGTTADRPLDLAVNGTKVASVSFPPTANWDTWATKSVTVQLGAGPNTIRATGAAAAGGPNVDKMVL
ncbi:MAG: carbohydrate-binding protein [Nonomuraea sp.]|nr:carbohydrate-binding protein [Nonomuraea sp.]